MNRKAVLAIAKDITSITSSVQLFLPIIVVPLIILILVPGGLLIAARYVDVTETTNMGPILKLLDNLPAGNLKTALDSFTDINQKMLFLFLNYFFARCFSSFPSWQQVSSRQTALLEKKKGALWRASSLRR